MIGIPSTVVMMSMSWTRPLVNSVEIFQISPRTTAIQAEISKGKLGFLKENKSR